jgi:hypothetical protein
MFLINAKQKIMFEKRNLSGLRKHFILFENKTVVTINGKFQL